MFLTRSDLIFNVQCLRTQIAPSHLAVIQSWGSEHVERLIRFSTLLRHQLFAFLVRKKVRYTLRCRPVVVVLLNAANRLSAELSTTVATIHLDGADLPNSARARCQHRQSVQVGVRGGEAESAVDTLNTSTAALSRWRSRLAGSATGCGATALGRICEPARFSG